MLLVEHGLVVGPENTVHRDFSHRRGFSQSGNGMDGFTAFFKVVLDKLDPILPAEPPLGLDLRFQEGDNAV